MIKLMRSKRGIIPIIIIVIIVLVLAGNCSCCASGEDSPFAPQLSPESSTQPPQPRVSSPSFDIKTKMIKNEGIRLKIGQTKDLELNSDSTTNIEVSSINENIAIAFFNNDKVIILGKRLGYTNVIVRAEDSETGLLSEKSIKVTVVDESGSSDPNSLSLPTKFKPVGETPLDGDYIECSDSDAGATIGKRGTTVGRGIDGKVYSKTDQCSSAKLREYICQGDNLMQKDINCDTNLNPDSVCVDGTCT